MYTKWTSHISSDKDKELFQNRVLGSKDVLDRILDILHEDLKSLETIETSLSSLDQPNWALRQAYITGDKNRLKTIIKLVDLNQQKETK